MKFYELITSHFIVGDFNGPSACGLSKAHWKYGTNNWDWVNCPACLKHRLMEEN